MTSGHHDLVAEARALLEVLTQKLEQAATPAADAGSHSDSAADTAHDSATESATESATDSAGNPATATHDGARCTGCPVCAALTYLKEHREISAQLAHGALIIVGAVRQYLDQSTPAGTARPSSASVQHIDIS